MKWNGDWLEWIAGLHSITHHCAIQKEIHFFLMEQAAFTIPSISFTSFKQKTLFFIFIQWNQLWNWWSWLKIYYNSTIHEFSKSSKTMKIDEIWWNQFEWIWLNVAEWVNKEREWNELLWNESKEGNEIKLILIDLMEWTSAAQWNKRNGTVHQAGRRGKLINKHNFCWPALRHQKVVCCWMSRMGNKIL